MLVIDTWRLLLGSVDENKAQVVVNGLTQLSKLRKRRPGLAIILIHHLRKQFANNPVSLREDPYTWIESVSGHHALVGHVDAAFGLEREIAADGEQLLVFGGVARNSASGSMLLEDDEETLLFSPASGIEALGRFLTTKENEFFRKAQQLRRFGFTELVKACNTTNKKTVTSMLRKAVTQLVIVKEGESYRLVN